jgi:hypothetical protein
VAQHLLGAAAQPVEERPVGEPVAEAAIDVGQRQPERVQLALRNGLEVAALERIADRLHGRHVGAKRHSLQGHVRGRPGAASRRGRRAIV